MEKKLFIAYSWDDETHNEWVRNLADKLIENGVNVLLDQYEMKYGKSFTHFMEESIETSDKVIVVLTPNYKLKSNNRLGGVGYEQQIISGEIMSGMDRQKFIPIIVAGEYEIGENCSVPTHFLGVSIIDFRNNEKYNSSLDELLRSIYDSPKFKKPEKGKIPNLPSFSKKTFKIELTENFECKQSNIILADYFTQIIDLRNSGKSYSIEFEIETISEIYRKYNKLQGLENPSEDDLTLKLNYRTYLNSIFFWNNNNNNTIYDLLIKAIENIIIYSYIKNGYIYNIEDLVIAIKNSFKYFSPKSYSEKGKGFDVFYDQNNWDFKIFIEDDEIIKLLNNIFKIKNPIISENTYLLSRYGDLNVYDLKHETLIGQVIPKQTYSYVFKELNEKISIEEKEQYFKIGNWKIGLA
jgi:hypothetical protein